MRRTGLEKRYRRLETLRVWPGSASTNGVIFRYPEPVRVASPALSCSDTLERSENAADAEPTGAAAGGVRRCGRVNAIEPEKTAMGILYRLFRRMGQPSRRVQMILTGAAIFWTVDGAAAQEPYRMPPQEIVSILDAPPVPAVSLNPGRDQLLLVERRNLPPIADLARPMLRLAGFRIDPLTQAPHGPRAFVGLTLKRMADGAEKRVPLPDEADLGFPSWSPDGSRFAFTLRREAGVELWVGEVASGTVRALSLPPLNSTAGSAFSWMPDSRRLVCKLVPEGQGLAPQRPALPAGPVTQETHGRVTPVRTYQDLLEDAHDEALFEHYFTSQLALVDIESGEMTNLGEPALYSLVSPSPDGTHFLVSRWTRPFSYLAPAFAFPAIVEVWDVSGRAAREIARLPLRDDTPIQGVPVGPRNFQWRGASGAELLWVEAMDGGDPRKTAPHRDRVLQLAAPFDGRPVELLRTEHRFSSLSWLEGEEEGLVTEFDPNRRWTRTWLYDFSGSEEPPRLVSDRSVRDRYNDPGTPVTVAAPSGRPLVQVHDGRIYLSGSGASPQGDRPFLDRMDLATFAKERLWQCEGESYETVVDVLSEDGGIVLTRFETTSEPPTYFVRDLNSGKRTRITDFPDPAPQLRGIHRELVTYEREDGVPLSATLYLPAGYESDRPLPLVVWAYPREFTDRDTAGQVSGSPYRFTSIGGSSHLFFLTQGYAVMDNAAMPVVGDVETMNDTFIEQVVAGARAAVEYAVGRGIADPQRVGVGGHSYGAFMTATLLAHSDLFRAGIARSGAYNRTLTPFGFQSERRTLWEAPESYFRLSPFMHAHQIRAPILLIHGQIDNNSGTFPMQSERLYHAVKGHGGTARLVMLPFESHGYRARESVLHALAEMIGWFDRHLKPEAQEQTHLSTAESVRQ
jgi:dipeptidyl aminopeptidase/acylaminoacyl peptidase